MSFLKHQLEAFQFRFGWGDPRQTLSEVLQKANPTAEYEDQVEWLNDLIDWIRRPVLPGESSSKNRIQSARLRFFIQFLERHDELRSKVSDTIHSILLQVDPVSLFCQVGLSQDQGFIRELLGRIALKFLPRYSDPRELAELFQQIFRDTSDALWVASLDSHAVNGLIRLFGQEVSSNASIVAKFSDAMFDASLVLSSRIMAISVHPDIRSRLPRRSLNQSPFFNLNSVLIKSRDEFLSGSTIKSIAPSIFSLIEQCQLEIHQVHLGIEAAGASVDLIYRLERASQGLRRIRRVFELMSKGSEQTLKSTDVISLIVDLLLSFFESRSIRGLMRTNLYLQSLKIVEHTGQSGEMYLTYSRTDYLRLFRSAAGGGFIAAFTSLFKIMIIKLPLPTFFEGMLSWINYSASFMAMQLMHFTLATKTPSATAATLASRLGTAKANDNYEGLTNEVAAITRSSVAGILGNLGMVIPTALLLNLLIQTILHRPTLSTTYALDIIREVDPIRTLTIFYSFMTAGALWLSAVGGSWLENWFTVARLNLALSQSRRLRTIFGQRRAEKISKWILKNINGFGTNLFLGLLLAAFGVAHDFFGLPVDVRHVTLTTGKVVLAIASLDSPSQYVREISWAIGGIFVIGLINFIASFLFSFFFAARAKGMNFMATKQALGSIQRHFWRAPIHFLLPIRRLIRPGGA